MRAISTGNIFDVCDNTLQTYDSLPAMAYKVVFSQTSGFHLQIHSDLEIKESKVYGVHNEKIKKVLNAFEKFERNLGVILSGDKGIGKSLFARMLANESIKKGYPLIIVDQFYPGIASYIESIKQEVVVLFDEFDKTFAEERGESGRQATMLSLFDGVDSGKRLFIVTCNSLKNLNDFIVNRPGRFHYHFRFEYPNHNEVREYLTDKLDPKYAGEIYKVVSFSNKIDLNYDCLRAIAFELNQGETFESAIKDLNIINNTYETYDVSLHFKDGTILKTHFVRIDMFDHTDECCIYFDEIDDQPSVTVKFNTADVIYDQNANKEYITADKFKLSIDKNPRREGRFKEANRLESVGAACMVFDRNKVQAIHYQL